MKKIAVFTGTRADYGLLYWLMKDIDNDPNLELHMIVSGSHLSPEFGLTYQDIERDGFNISAKVEMLLSSDTAVGVAKSVGLATISLADALARIAPDTLIVLGDRFEALAAAQAAMFLGVPVAHAHGGEKTEGAYDESIRHAITKLSHLHFTATAEYRLRVIQLGESPGTVFNVGALGLDHIARTPLMSKETLSESLDFELGEKFFVVTYHPETLSKTNVQESFGHLLKALDNFSDYQLIITYPNADDGGRKIIDQIETYQAGQPERVKALPSLGFVRYLSAVKLASAVIGNSSSGIIEVPSLKVPTINIGDRQKGRLAADSIIHCSAQTSDIIDAISHALSASFSEKLELTVNPYGMGNASAAVIQKLKAFNTLSPKAFYDLPGGDI